MKKIYFLCSLMLALAFLMTACEKNLGPKKGMVEFNANIKSGLKSISNSDSTITISYALIEIQNGSGEIFLSNEKITLTQFGDSYLSDPVSLNPGSYILTKFVLVNDQNMVVYASPLDGSEKAYLVQNPLPIEFMVSEDFVTKVSPEVVDAIGKSPQDFGYATFSFNVVKTFDFLLSVFIYNDSISNYELTNARVSIYSDSLLIYSGQLESEIDGTCRTNQITLPEDYQNYTLYVSKEGYTSYIKQFSKEELKLHFLESDQGPLVVILKKAEQGDGLVAYYPFNGNANDESGNGNNGTVHGASLTEDRFENSNSAYYLDGISNYISIINSSSLNPQSAFTLCAWYKSYDFIGAGYSPIIDKGYYSHTTPYYQYKLGVCGNYSTNYQYSMSFSVTTNNEEHRARSNKNYWIPGNWYFLVGTYDGSNVQLYINNQLIQSIPATGLINNYETPIYFGNNITADDFLKGVIDDIRIYNRALSEGEIKLLYELGK